MTTDPPGLPSDALEARARRGTPRGADVVLSAARAGTSSALVDGGPDRRRRRATLAAAAIVLIGLAGGVLALAGRDRDPEPAVAASNAYCRALAARAVGREGIDPDLSVFVTPASSAGDVAAVGDALRDDPRVEAVHYVDATEALAQFRRLFAGEEAILANVRASDLPTSYEVRLVAGVDLENAIASFYEVAHVFDAVAETIRHARVLDLLVASGHQFLHADGPLAASYAPFARRWPDLVAAVRVDAPPASDAAVDRLAAELRRRQALAPGTELEVAPAREVDADLLARSAADGCDLEAAAWATAGEQGLDRVLSDAQLLPSATTTSTTTATTTPN